MEVSLIGVEKSGLLVFLSVQVYFKVEGGRQLDLDLVHCIDITRLDKVLKLFNLLTQLLDGDLVILDSAHDLIINEHEKKSMIAKDTTNGKVLDIVVEIGPV